MNNIYLLEKAKYFLLEEISSLIIELNQYEDKFYTSDSNSTPREKLIFYATRPLTHACFYHCVFDDVEKSYNVNGVIFCKIRHEQNFMNSKQITSLIVNGLYVRNKSRRAGIASALLSQAHYWAKNKGATKSFLSVDTRNIGAISFYQSMSYNTLTQWMEKSL